MRPSPFGMHFNEPISRTLSALSNSRHYHCIACGRAGIAVLPLHCWRSDRPAIVSHRLLKRPSIQEAQKTYKNWQNHRSRP